jgi:hypothetical protein
MKKLVLAAIAFVAFNAANSAQAADMHLKAPAPLPAPSIWDIAFGGGLTSNYVFRGITQSNHRPSVSGYFEPRLNVTKDVQIYAGLAGNSISLPNRAAAEIDLWTGVRTTFGALALDFGAWYYWYPGGECFNNSPPGSPDCALNGPLPVNDNVIKADLSFYEVYAKATFTVNDQVVIGGSLWYSPNVLNTSANGTYASANIKFSAPSSALPTGWGAYFSAEVGYWWLGTSDAFYAVPGFPNGIDYTDYATWNVGFGISKGVFTLDLRYYDTNLNQGDCNAFTSDYTARFSGSFTPINPGGFGSNWCGQRYVVSGKFDLTAIANLK